MDTLVFEVISGFLLPRSPSDQCEPDGERFLSEDQAAEKFSVSHETLRAFYARALKLNPEPVAEKPIDLALRKKYENFSDDLFVQFIERMRLAGLDPWTPDVYPSTEPDERTGMPRLVIMAGVNHFRRVAAAHPKYRGQRGPFYCGEDQAWTELWLRDDPPWAAKLGAVVAGEAEPTWAVCTFRDYAAYMDAERNRLVPSWAEKPCLRLGACVECAALRRAFGDRLGSFYGTDEMAHRKNPRRAVSSRIISPPKMKGLHFVPDDWGAPIVPLE